MIYNLFISILFIGFSFNSSESSKKNTFSPSIYPLCMINKYKANEFSLEKINFDFYGLFFNNGRYFIRKTKVKYSKVADEDKEKRVWRLGAYSKDSCLYLFSFINH